LIDFERLNT